MTKRDPSATANMTAVEEAKVLKVDEGKKDDIGVVLPAKPSPTKPASVKAPQSNFVRKATLKADGKLKTDVVEKINADGTATTTVANANTKIKGKDEKDGQSAAPIVGKEGSACCNIF